jgi:small-conductance mechanosensitive channel
MTPTQEWFSGFNQVGRQVLAFAPLLASAALLALAGWVLGRILRFLATRAVSAVLVRLGAWAPLRGALVGSGAAGTLPALIGGFVFWLVFLFFLATALETLGLPVVTGALNRVAYYLPNVLAALVVLFAGLILGSVVRGAVARTATSAGVDFGTGVGTVAQGIVVLVAVVVALEQVGIEAQVLVVIVAIVLGTTLAGAGLAFGLGARTAVSSIIASYYVAQAYRIGQQVRIGNIEGRIVQTTPTAVFLDTPQGRVLVPAKQFSEEASVLVTER